MSVTSPDDPGTAERMAQLLAEAQALAHLGVWEWDVVRNRLYWSDELYQILGLAPRELAPGFEALLARVHPEDVRDVRQYLARAEREPGPLGIEYRIARPSGDVRTVQSRARSVFDASGALIRILGTEQDVTDTKDLAARLVFSDRMISIGTLAGGMAHEINNPLATISAYIDLLAEFPEARESDALVGEARAAIDRIRNIMRGLAAFSRADQDVRGPLDVERVLELAIGIAGNEVRHRARLVKELSRTPPVHANEARLGHVFINLLINAAEAIPEGQADRHEIHITTRTDAAGWVVVDIRDTGAGIPRDPGPHLRPVLHHQAGRQRHRPRAVDLPRHRAVPRRRDPAPQRGRARLDVQRVAAALEGGAAPRAHRAGARPRRARAARPRADRR